MLSPPAPKSMYGALLAMVMFAQRAPATMANALIGITVLGLDTPEAALNAQ